MFFDGAGELGLHLKGAGAQRRAGPTQPLDQQRHGVERDPGSLLIGNLCDAPINGNDIKIALHIRAAYHINHDLRPLAAGRLAGRLDEITGFVVDRHIGADFKRGLAFLIRSAGNDNSGFKRLGKQNSRRADARGPAMQEHCFTWFKRGALKHIAPYGKIGFGDRSGFDKAHTVGYRQRVGFMHDRPFSVSPAGDERHHPISRLKARGIYARAFNRSGDLKTQNVTRPRRGRIISHALHDIGAVDARGVNSNEHLARARNRSWPRNQLQCLGAAGIGGDDRIHHGHGDISLDKGSIGEEQNLSSTIKICNSEIGKPIIIPDRNNQNMISPRIFTVSAPVCRTEHADRESDCTINLALVLLYFHIKSQFAYRPILSS